MKPAFGCGSFCRVLVFGLFLAPFWSITQAQFLRHPPPGSVFRDYTQVMAGDNYRVTDPNASNVGAAEFLPNPVMNLSVADLQDAVRAEVIVDFWSGHPGTQPRQLRFNGNTWITIPELATTTSGNPNCYLQQVNFVVDVPLEHLVQGNNTFEGTSGGQSSCGNINWGQWGWYQIALRVYYNPATKSHATGSITSPSSGGVFGDNPTVTATASGGAGVNQVDFFAYFDGYDPDGDGRYRDWQVSYQRRKSPAIWTMTEHVGLATSAPFSVVWDTTSVPDQPLNGVKLIAHIRDNGGYVFVTDEVASLSLERTTNSVRLYRAVNVPDRFVVRANATKFCYIPIPGGDNLANATSAQLLVRSWNARHPEHALRVNTWEAPLFGEDHFYGYSKLPISPAALVNGTNIVMITSTELVHHGMEIMWPGPALVVRYNLPPRPPVQLPSFYSMDEPSGTQINDVSGHGNHGQIVAQAARTASGRFGGGVQFNGQGHVDMGAMHFTGTGLTISMWAYVDSATLGDARLFAKALGLAVVDGYCIVSLSSQNRVRFRLYTSSAAGDLVSSASLTLNAWNHVAVTYDGAFMRIYVNGVQRGSVARTGEILHAPNVPVWLGDNPGPDRRRFTGRIDELRVYNFAQSSAQITADMNRAISGVDVTPPTAPSNLSATLLSLRAVQLNWTGSTDAVGVSFYRIRRDGVIAGTSPTLSFTDQGWSSLAGTSYEVRAVDGAGNESNPSNIAVANETQPPTVPQNVTLTVVTPSRIDVSWTASTDNLGVSHYLVLRDGNEVGAATGAFFSDTGLASETEYTYRVIAVDLLGNQSAPSTPVMATTLPPDLMPPSVPEDLAATPVSPTQISLAWTPSTDNVGVAFYRLFRDGDEVAMLQGTSFLDTGLAADTEYIYTVVAVDGSDNSSAPSDPAVATTLSLPPIPTDGLAVWLRADFGTTLDGSTLAQWNDQSGGGRHAVQPSAGNQPLWVENALNGMPVVRFDGANDFLTFTLPVNGLNGLSVFLVTSSTQEGTTHPAERAALFWNETAAWGTIYLSPFPSNVKLRFGTKQSGNSILYNRPQSIGTQFSLTTAIKAGTTDSLFVNRVQVLQQSGKLPTIDGCRDTGNIGRGFNDNTYFSGDIAEVLVFTRGLTQIERGAVEEYLDSKYGLTDVSAPLITTHPQSVSVEEPDGTSFTVSADGPQPFTYQWRRNGVAIAGATGTSLAISSTSVAADNGAQFDVVITNPFGSTTSQAATLTVTPKPPAIVDQPASISVQEPAPAMFSVLATGSAPLTYQWRRGGVDIPGATTSTYTLSPTANAVDDGAQFDVVVSNGAGSVTSDPANLTVTVAPPSPPQVTDHPMDVTVSEPNGATFSVTVTGSLPLTYQWRRNGVDIPGATASAYTLSPTSHAADDGVLFDVVISNGLGSVTSNPATLTVRDPNVVPQAGLALWLRADAGTGSNGTALSQWSDQSGNNRHAVQAAASSQPVVVDQGVNGLPVVRFDGVNDFATFGLPVNGLAGISIFLVASAAREGTSHPAERAALFWNETASWGTLFLSPFPSNIKLRFGTRQSNNQITYTRPASIGSAFTLTTAVKDGTTDSLYVNGALASSAGGKLSAIAGCRDTGNLGRGFNDNTFFTGDIAEVLVYTRALTTQERLNLEQHLMEKYNLGQGVPPQIVVQPAGRVVTENSAATFSVSAAGTPPLAYQWRRNGVSINGANGTSYTLNSATQADNGAQFDVIVSNVSGAVTSQVAVLTVRSWWNTQWQYRFPININVGAHARVDKPANVPVNFTQLLAPLGGGAFNDASIRVIEVSSVGAILNTAVPFQFDKDPAYNASSNARGTLVFILGGNTPANSTRYFHVYFDVAAGFTAANVTTQVAITDNVVHEGQSSFRVTTPNGTYYYHKQGAGFASIDDANGNDWIGYRPSGGASGEFRGLPNMGDVAHPGYLNSTSSIVSVGPLKATILSVSTNNAWRMTWEFYPSYATMRLLQAGGNYWLLYEGTPGGSFQPATDFWTRSSGETLLCNQDWVGDVPGPEWVYFGDASISRVFFLAHHEDDTAMDQYWQLNNAMTVFGFGREYTCCGRFLTAVPAHLTIGFNADAASAPAAINSAFRDLSTSTGAAETQTPGQGSISVTVVGSGSVVKNPDQPVYDVGQVVQLSAVPVAGWGFAGWSGALTGAANPAGLTVNANHSVTATFTNAPPQIAGHPSNSTVIEPGAATFTVVATGSAPITYQWRRGGVPIPGATAASYVLSPTTLADSGAQLDVVVSNLAGSVTSQPATLTVTVPPPQITGHPADLTVTEPAAALFSVNASGTGPLSYQWRRGGIPIAGATSASYQLNSTARGADNGAQFDVIVSNLGGSATSQMATLTVNAPPQITLQPANVAVVEPGSASFTVAATGTEPLSYQWRRGGTPIPGATGPTYVLDPTSRLADHGAQFDVVVSNPLGSATSAAAILSVIDANVVPQTGLALWLRADAGTILDGGAVSQWSDQSGNGRHAAQTLAASRPVVAASALNGLPAVRFDGANDFLSFNLPVNGLTGLSIFLVAASTDNGNSHPAEKAALFWNETAAWGTIYLSPFQSSVKLRFGTTQAANNILYSRPEPAGGEFTLTTAIKAGSVDSLYVDRVRVVRQTGKLSAIAGCRNTGDIGRGFNDNTYYVGDIAEILVYDRALSDQEREGVEQYLDTKYSLTPPAPPHITSQPQTTTTAGAAYMYDADATGNPPPTYSLTQAPAGMTIHPGSGLIQWTPAPAQAGFQVVQVTAQNSHGSEDQFFAVHVISCPLNVVSYWPLDETTGTSFLDLLEMNPAGCVPPNCPTPAAGKVNGAQIFTATTSLSVPAHSSLDFGNQESFTLEVWVQTMQQAVVAYIARLDSGSPMQYMLLQDSLGRPWFFIRDRQNNAVSDLIAPSPTPALGQWHHLVGVRDAAANQMRLYVDGVLVGSRDTTGRFTGDFSSPTATLDIGWVNSGTGFHLNGMLDEAALYRRALTDTEVLQRYTDGNSGARLCDVPAVTPQIILQPSPVTVLEPGAAVFNVAAFGSAPLSYQWRRNGMDIPGANGSSYTLSPTSQPLDNDAVFDVVISNGSGSVTSAGALLTVNLPAPEPPLITTPPADVTVLAPAAALFQVSATGTPPLSYQWRRNQSPIAGATSSSYQINPSSVADHGAQFDVIVSNGAGSVTSLAATLTVNAAPSIQTQPMSLAVPEPAPATFSVGASGSAPLGYQWRRGGVDIPGATGSSYTLNPTSRAADDGAQFVVVVSNPFGSVTSQVATLSVNSKPSIQTHPASLTVTQPAAATFNVMASGAAPLSYQWRRGGAPIAGATASSYTLNPTSLADSGARFDVVIANSFGAETSLVAVLTVLAPPAILVPPANLSVTEHSPASFGVVATGSAPLSYQWRRNGAPIAGATSSSYTLNPTSRPTDNGAQFSVVVGNPSGSVTSAVATLTVSALGLPSSGLALWLRADAGTALNGEAVNQWSDQSGNNRHAIQASSSSQPLLRMAASTGLPVLRFDGVNDFLTFPMQVNGLTGMSIFIVAANTQNQNGGTVQAERAALFWNETASWGTVYLSPFQSAVNMRFGTTQSGNRIVYTRPASVGSSFTLTASIKNGPTDSLYVNKTLVLSQGGKLSTIAGCRDTGNVARGLNDNTFYAGDIAEVVVYNRALDSAERMAVEQYLDAKYGLTAPAAPRITGHPNSVTVIEPAGASFSVAATGTAPLTYQWRRNGTAIPGATSAGYTLSSTSQAADNAAQFAVVVSNASGSVTSLVATLAVTAPTPTLPQITLQPVSLAVAEPNSATFTVNAAGTAPLAYQWRRNGTAIPGANGASYTLNPTSRATDNGAQFDVVVSNPAGSVSSQIATLTVTAPPPLITSQPMNVTVAEPASASFSVVASGTGPFTYQWRRGGTPIAGANSSTYVLNPTSVADNGALFDVLVGNAAGTVTSQGAILTVTGALPIPPAGLSLWLRADAGTELNGAALTQWNDQSGANRHAAQASGANQPVKVNGVLNGLPVVRFDGVNDFLAFGFPINGLTGMTIFLVAANTQNQNGGSAQAERAAIFWNETSAWGGAYLSPFQSSVNMRFGTRQTGNRILYTRAGSVGSQFTLTSSMKDGPADSLSINGIPVLNEGGKSSSIAGCRDIGNLGRGYNDNTFYAGDIAEVVVYNRALSTVERGSVEQYLISKYALSASAPPHVTGQPADTTVIQPNPASFSVAAVGASPLAYQWRRNGVAIPGATSATYVLNPTSVAADNGKSFDVVVSNGSGTATSQPAILTVLSPQPQITVQPASLTVIEPGAAILSVSAVGASPLAYQWRRNSSPIPGANSPTYTLNPTSHAADDGAVFDVVVSNGFGSVTSTTVTLTVLGDTAIPATGLALWLRADGGTVLNGGTLAQWTDQSGNNRHAVQPSTLSQPALVNLAVNGLPAVRFDGLNDFLSFNLPVNDLMGMSIFLVASAAQTGGALPQERAALFWNEVSSWGTIYLSPYPNAVNLRFGTRQVGNGIVYVRPTPVGNSFTLTTAIKNGTTDSLYVNGSLVVAEVGKLGAIAGCRDTGNVGRGYNDNTFYTGDIAEILVYNRALSAAEQLAVDQYLNSKYSLTPPAPPQIASQPQLLAVAGMPYQYVVSGLANPPPSYALLTGPAGMSIDPASGQVSWSPTGGQIGSHSVLIRAANALGQTDQAFMVQVVSCPPNLISYYPFDEIGGSLFQDAFSLNNAFCIPPDCPAPVVGVVGAAQLFNGVTTRISAPAHPIMDLATDDSFTFELWARTETRGETAYVGRYDPATGMEVSIGQDVSARPWFYIRDSLNNRLTTLIAPGDAPVLGVWHHVVGVRDAAANLAHLYIDGVLVNSKNTAGLFTGHFGSATATYDIGWLNLGHGYEFGGALDEVAFYRRALTAAEVQAHYNLGLLGLPLCAE